MLLLNPANPWNIQLENIMETNTIDRDSFKTLTKTQTKTMITNKLKTAQHMRLCKAAENKSKVRDYICCKPTKGLTSGAKYMYNLSRNECTVIANARARMIKVKGNYKTSSNNLECRWCKNNEETQIHVLTKCNGLNDIPRHKLYKDYFNDDIEITEKTAEILERINKKSRN